MQTPHEYLAEIGRRGGKTTGRKGLAAMTPTERKRISAKGVAARRRKSKAHARSAK